MAVSKCTYRFLGGSGLKVSNICLGAMTFGEHQLQDVRPGQCDEATAHAIMDRFAELGGNFIDTADAYQYGVSVDYVGSWLPMKQRDKFIIATKMADLDAASAVEIPYPYERFWESNKAAGRQRP
ncbi:uncharacterized protein LOC144925455 [Branchiostoma floridae x Branchiostoma belcheri]